jgi:hypothetical protein
MERDWSVTVAILRGNRRFWFIAVLGFGSAMSILAQSGPTYGEVGVSVLLGACGVLGVAALFGIGPLCRKAESVTGSGEGRQQHVHAEGGSSTDQLILLGELRGSGKITQEEFEAAKSRILDL